MHAIFFLLFLYVGGIVSFVGSKKAFSGVLLHLYLS